MKKSYKNILVYSGGEAIGDALYKLSFIQNLRYNFPNSTITWLAGQGDTEYSRTLKPIIKNLIDNVIDDVKIGYKPLFEFFRASPLTEKYDVIIDTQTVVMPTLLLKKIKHTIFLSATAKWFFSDIKPNNFSIKSSSLNERLNQFTLLLKKGNMQYCNDAIILEKKYLKLTNKLLPIGSDYIGISPGAGDKTKIWPINKFIKLAQTQVTKKRIPVFFLGPDEKNLLGKIKKEVPEAIFPEWTELAIKSGIKGPILVIALAKNLKVAIANDSGTGHMFALSGTSLISLFSKHNPIKYAPNAKRLSIIDSKNWGGTDPNLIPIKSVEKEIENLIQIDHKK
jgi:ADP-heptose:LPS heptosyltransferase